MATISIAKGLKSTYKNAREYSLSEAFLQLDKYTDNYEVLKPDFNRVYGDIDGKDFKGTEEEFNALDSATRTAIETFLGETPYSLLTASSFLHRKISWRFVLTNLKSSLKDNKEWVKRNISVINLPEGICFDTAPYGTNQKIRMVGSNKDGEKRPLHLIKGEKIDTLISYIPEDCALAPSLEKETEPKSSKKAVAKKHDSIDPVLLRKLVLNVKNDATTDWEHWYKVSQAIHNEGGDMDLFLEWSSKNMMKHNEREAVRHWASLKEKDQGKLTSASIYYWSKLSDPVEHEKIILDSAGQESYHRKKILFEREHFKLKNPACYIREYEGSVQTMTDNSIESLYLNFYCTNDEGVEIMFIRKWMRDPEIRTYETMAFEPGKQVPSTVYNLFKKFQTNQVQGDCSMMNELMWNLSGKNQEVFDYLENYFAHLIQKPGEKPKVCLVFSTEKQGAGKDTVLDTLGKIIGEYFFNTGDPENMVFSRFNAHLQKTLLLKLEEVNFETNKKNESKLLNLITATTQSYEGKGREAINLNDYKRIVMTTNKSIPVNIPESDRRFVLINPSEDMVGNHEYWNKVYAELENPDNHIVEAWHHHLATKDISGWNPKNRPITDYYKEVKLALRPYHASYFQHWLAQNGEIFQQHEQTATDWLRDVNIISKFAISSQKFGRDMKLYFSSGAIVKRETKFGSMYTVNSEKMLGFLKEKSWWNDC
jgi:hypothetical protein